MAKILITGGCGMIGSNLCRRLIDEGHEVVLVDNLWRGRLENLDGIRHLLDYPDKILIRDLALPGALDDVLPSCDYVFHLADIVAGIGFVFQNQRWLMRQNLLINSNVFDSASKCAASLKGVIYVGTACSYPKDRQFGVESPPLREDEMYPANPESAYGWSKLMGQIEVQLLESELGIPVAVPILHNVFGTPCDVDPKRSQVIPSLCRRVAETSEEIVVWGSGKQGRAFVHVDDIVEALVLSMNIGLGKGEIQIGPSICTSIRDIAHMLVDISGKPLRLKFDTTKPEGDGGRCAEGSKAQSVLGWTPRIDIRKGLEMTYAWVEAKLQSSREPE